MSPDEPPSIPSIPGVARRRFWRWLGIGLLLLLVVAGVMVHVFYIRDVPLKVSTETTYITEPLTADGQRVDYLAAIEQLAYPPGLQAEENGFRRIIEAVGISPDTPPEEGLQVYEFLELDSRKPGMEMFEDPHSYLYDYVDAELAAARVPLIEYPFEMDQPWTREQLPMMADWLDHNTAMVDVVGEAVRQPEFVIPYTSSPRGAVRYTAGFYESRRLRSFANGFRVRAQYRLAAGDVDGAIDDIVSCARLGRQLQGPGFSFNNLVGVAFEAQAQSVGAGGSLEHQPTEQQWQRLLDELNQLPERGPIAQSLEIERLNLLDRVQSMAHGELDEILNEHEEILRERNYGLDWNVVARRVNENYDRWLLGHTMVEVDASALDGFYSRGERSTIFADVISDSLAYPVQKAFGMFDGAICRENLLRIVITMLLYEKQHGTLPPAYSVDDQGNPLHSWRVLILPYLGYDKLYSQIRLDEPWDSVHNQQFHTADVPVYQCPSMALAPGMTEYAVVEGPTCPFNGSEPRRLDEFGEHSANMILVVERVNAACWMDPTQEVPFADAILGINIPGATTGLGSHHDRIMHVGLRSGAARAISDSIDREILAELLEGTSDWVP